MAKISGISFEDFDAYREKVSVTLPGGVLFELPLITTRDAQTADTFLKRNDVIRTQYVIVQERLRQRASACEAVQKELDNHPENIELAKRLNSLDQIETAMKAIEESQKQIGELNKKCYALCNEIHDFIAPYLVGTQVIEMLKKCEDVVTIQVLQMMLWGAAALKEDKGEAEKENPTTPPSATN